MKKLKIAFYFLILAALFVVVYQNWAFFSAPQSLSVDLKVRSYHSIDLPTGLFLLGTFLIGFLIAYTGGLINRFKAGRMVKELNAVIDSQQEKISALRGEMDLLKRHTPVPEASAAPADRESEAPVAGMDETPQPS